MSRSTLSMQGRERREQPALQKPAPAPPPAHGHRGAGCPRAPGRWGWSRDAPAPSCTSLSCPVTWPCWGLGLWGQHVPLPGGVPALHPLHPVAACGAACREGLRLCLGEGSFGAGGEGRLSAALPDAPAVATQTKPSRSAEPLGHPQLLKSAFHFPNLPALNLTLSSDVFGWQLTRSAGGSRAGGGCAAPSLPHRAHQNWRNRSKKEVMPACGSQEDPWFPSHGSCGCQGGSSCHIHPASVVAVPVPSPEQPSAGMRLGGSQSPLLYPQGCTLPTP